MNVEEEGCTARSWHATEVTLHIISPSVLCLGCYLVVIGSYLETRMAFSHGKLFSIKVRILVSFWLMCGSTHLWLGSSTGAPNCTRKTPSLQRDWDVWRVQWVVEIPVSRAQLHLRMEILTVLQASRGKRLYKEVIGKGDERFCVEFGEGSAICRPVRGRAKSSWKKRPRMRCPLGAQRRAELQGVVSQVLPGM